MREHSFVLVCGLLAALATDTVFRHYTCAISSTCSLKQLDVAFMKQLHEKVNIVPVIAKADTFTPEECERFKSTVSQAAVWCMLLWLGD